MDYTSVRYQLPDSQMAQFVAGIRKDTRSRIHLVYAQPRTGLVRLVKLPLTDEKYMTPLGGNLRPHLAVLKRMHKTHGGSPSARRFLKEATASWKQHSTKASETPTPSSKP